MLIVDLDGVLANFVKAACEIHGKCESSATCWNFFKDWGISAADFWKPIHAAGEQWWAELEPFPWTEQLLAMMKQADPDFMICSDAMGARGAADGKQAWLERYLGPNFDVGRVHFTRRKEVLAAPGRLLIDDADHNVNDFRAKHGCAYLLPQPWNSAASRVADREDRLYWLRRTLEAYRLEKGFEYCESRQS